MEEEPAGEGQRKQGNGVDCVEEEQAGERNGGEFEGNEVGRNVQEEVEERREFEGAGGELLDEQGEREGGGYVDWEFHGCGGVLSRRKKTREGLGCGGGGGMV